MRISLGPLLYYWSREDVEAFYAEAASWPVDTVYLGETVCSRRHLLRLPDWLEVAARLADAGKEVVLSTQTLIESESDLKALRKLVRWAAGSTPSPSMGEGDASVEAEDVDSIPSLTLPPQGGGNIRVEANEFGAIRLLAEAGVPFVAGPALNVYNPDTLALLAESGARRWVPPVEMPRDMLDTMTLPAGMETELFAYGRLPLAFSARCFTARHYNLQKDDCQFKCLEHPDGLAMRTREGEDFLTLNGIQTQSGKVHSLAHRLDELQSRKIDLLRLSPQSRHMGRVVEVFRGLLDGAIAPSEAPARLQRFIPGTPCDGYWLGKAGMEYQPNPNP